jgi:hypothetical protein
MCRIPGFKFEMETAGCLTIQRVPPVEMTILLENGIPCFQEKYGMSFCNGIVMSTGAYRSGEIRGIPPSC